MTLLLRSNDALRVNPPTGSVHHLTTHGSDWLWAVCAVYCLALLAVVALTFRARDGEKIFHYLFTISLFVGSIAYFAMASDLGSTPVATVTNAPGTRQIFYARYINWFCGWPPVIIALGLLSGVSWSTIVFNVALTWIWISSWLAGALVRSTYKWGFFVFGVFAMFLLATSLLFFGTTAARRVGINKHYTMLTGWVAFLWLLYPIAWGLDDGGNRISVTGGFIFFGILDLLLVPVLAGAFLFLSRNWDYRTLNLYFTQYGRVSQGGEYAEREKVHGGPAPGAPVYAPATTHDAAPVHTV